MPRGAFFALALLFAAVLALGACKPAPAPAPRELPGAASEPAAAVRLLAQRLHDNDLAGFARAAVPAAEYARLETAWREGRSRWPLSELPLDDQLVPLLQTLSAPGAERALMLGFDRQFAHQDRDIRDAARNLGLFGVSYVHEQPDYDDAQRRHYTQAIAALSGWAQRAPLGDPKRAQAAIARLCAAARRTGLGSEQALRDAGMEASLRQLSPFFAELKAVLSDYGLPLDDTLSNLRAGLAEQNGDRAKVDLRYPLAGQEIDTVAELERREGRWYLSGHLHAAEQALANGGDEAAAGDDNAPLPALPSLPQGTPTPSDP